MGELPPRRSPSPLLTAAVCVAILAGATGLIAVIRSTEPEAERTGATRQSAALVHIVVVSNATYRPVMSYLGTVEPARDILLSPRVPGRIVDMAPRFAPGGFVEAGEVLLKIDPEDFRNIVALRQSALHETEALLAVEEGRRTVAAKEFELLGQDIDAASRALVLREPQIASARAQVKAAETALAQARLDLERTDIRAPFDAHILSREADVGSQVAPGDNLGRLVGLETYWIETTVPLRDLDRIRFPGDGVEGSPVRVRHRTAWAPDRYREGRVESLIGTVDRQTRLARILVTIEDPLARRHPGPPLLLGTVVEAAIEGREIADVVRLDRNYLRDGDTVWVLRDEALEIRSVHIAFEDAQFAYIRDGLADGEEVVTTGLATVAPGIRLQRIDTKAPETEALVDDS